nr:hypothetical protein [Tanacetum cinerariifolium]
MNAIKSELDTELPTVPTRTVSCFVQEFICVKKPDKVKVKNPTGVRPKGREKQKRIKSGREISMKKNVKKRNKKLNGCGVCGSTSHNRRTCPWKNDVDVLYPAVVVPGGSDHVDGGLRDPGKVKVKNPTGIKPKGREKQKRIKSGREISMKKIVVPSGGDHLDSGLRDGASGSVLV